MKVKKSTLYMLGIIVLVIVAGFFLIQNNPLNENIINEEVDAGIQKVVLGIRNGNYYPNTVTVKTNEPVRIYLDSSVSGCYRSFTIKDFGVAKNLRMPNDYVEFTPIKKGTFRFACSMGMGTGTLIVE